MRDARTTLADAVVQLVQRIGHDLVVVYTVQMILRMPS
jgi:hypothetical protein